MLILTKKYKIRNTQLTTKSKIKMKSLIKAVKKVWHKTLVMCRFRKDIFYYEIFIYVYEDGRICRNGMTSIVKFLDKFKVEAYSKTEADFEAKRIAKEKHPDYAGALWFW